MQILEQTTKKQTLSTKGVEELAQHIKLEGNRTKRCVDGRYESDPKMPECSEPGGDAGALMISYAALLNLGVGITFEVSQKVREAAVEEAGGITNFHFHTDDHHHGEIAGGCGHISNALKDPGAYGITGEIARIIKDQLVELKAGGAVEEELHGEHQEGAVVVVKGEHGMAPNDGQHQAFVYQESMADKSRAKLSSILAESLGIDPGALSSAMNTVARLQLNETLKRLAKGLPVFIVDSSGDQMIVTQQT